MLTDILKAQTCFQKNKIITSSYPVLTGYKALTGRSSFTNLQPLVIIEFTSCKSQLFLPLPVINIISLREYKDFKGDGCSLHLAQFTSLLLNLLNQPYFTRKLIPGSTCINFRILTKVGELFFLVFSQIQKYQYQY